ncbi:aldo/keto reductase [Staphylococcus kloosii]|uniref:aldo/keto reductase n=1 Tax=Staphylococcus kloosii TaxID=29384 RepID=UPI0028A3A2BD|nr:aldo/keto reductase [Staphylococcus kloosii]MDT3958604.1 aldo/keto reductase [Staphylococcus kloosii]
MNQLTFNNGNEMPQIGLGVFRVANDDTAKLAVKHAIINGYRSIDAALVYENEEMVGQGIKEGISAVGISREDLFITSKLWFDDFGKHNVIRGYERSLNNLGLNYLDLYLVHWPGTDEALMIDTWLGMEKLYEDGKVKNIGVSNFNMNHLARLKKHAQIKPVINQVEFHPYFNQALLRNYLTEEGIQMESWSPLMNAEILADETINEIAQTINKSPAQVVLRWNVQHGVITIPKSITPARIEQNIDVFGFELSESQMTKIDKLNKEQRVGPDPAQFNG